MLVLSLNPIELAHDLGPSLAAAALCTGLFVVNAIQINRLKDRQARSDSDIKDKFASLHRVLAEGLRSVSESTSKLVDDQQKFVSSVAQDNREIATTLVNLTNSIDKVVARLIEVIREVEKT